MVTLEYIYLASKQHNTALAVAFYRAAVVAYYATGGWNAGPSDDLSNT